MDFMSASSDREGVVAYYRIGCSIIVIGMGVPFLAELYDFLIFKPTPRTQYSGRRLPA